MKYANLTTAQKELLDLLQHKEVDEYYDALKTIYYLGTYGVGVEKVELLASRYVYDLLDAIQKIVIENCGLRE